MVFGETIGTNPKIWDSFQQWIRDHKSPHISEDMIPWIDIRDNFGDFTLDGAIESATNNDLVAPLLSLQSKSVIEDEDANIRAEIAHQLFEIIRPVREQGIPESVIRKALEDIGINFTINRIQRGVSKKLYEEALGQLAQLRKLFGEMVLVPGTAKTYPREAPPPPPTPPPTGVRGPERYATVLANRILKTNNYFEVLGVPLNSTDKDVRDARNELLQLFHPDVFPNTDLGKVVSQKINNAYDALKTQELRARYHPPGQVVIPTVTVQVGDPITYCNEHMAMGLQVIMRFNGVVYGQFKTKRSYREFECPINPKEHKKKLANYFNGVFYGIG